MRRIYTCLLELADPSSAAPRVARALTKRWVGRAYGGWPEHAPEQWRPEPGVTVRWRLLDHPQRVDEAFELVWTRPHAAGPDAVAARDRADHDDGRRGPGAHPRAARVRGPEGAGRAGAAGPAADARARSSCARSSASTAAGTSPRARTGSTRHAPRTSTRSCAAIGGCRSCSSRPMRAEPCSPTCRGSPTTWLRSRTSSCSTAPAAVARAGRRARAAVGARPRAACACCGRRGDRPIRRVTIRSWRAEEVSGPDGPRAAVAEILSDLVLGAATLRVEGDPLVELLARSQDTVDLAGARASSSRACAPRCSTTGPRPKS